MTDPVNHPAHYTSHPSGIECIQVVEHMGFNLGNAIKYLWRADEKGNAIEDLRKAAWYVQREIGKRQRERDLGPRLCACGHAKRWHHPEQEDHQWCSAAINEAMEQCPCHRWWPLEGAEERQIPGEPA